MDKVQSKLSDDEFENLKVASADKIVLLQDISTKSISCSRCRASANNSNEIEHKSCCPYIGGHGC